MGKQFMHNNGSNQAHIMLNFKRKLDLLQLCERTLDPYGKQGIMWHDSMIQYMHKEDE